LSALLRCGAQCLDDFYSAVRGKALKGGYITVLPVLPTGVLDFSSRFR